MGLTKQILKKVAKGQGNVFFVAATGFLFCAFVKELRGGMSEHNIIAELRPNWMHPVFTHFQTVSTKRILPKTSQVRNSLDKRLDDRHSFGTIGNLVNDPMMKPDFKTPNRFSWS